VYCSKQSAITLTFIEAQRNGIDFRRRTQSKQILYKFTEMENAIKRTEMPEVMAYLWWKCAYLLTKSVISNTKTESIWPDVWKFR